MIADCDSHEWMPKLDWLKCRKIAVLNSLKIALLCRKRSGSNQKTEIGEELRLSHRFDREAELPSAFCRLE